MNDRYDLLDITKFVLSIFVVAIHCSLLPELLFPWLRLAVPLFFIISSFLLYNQIQKRPENKWIIIKKSVKRQLKLYFVWFILLLPFTLYIRSDWLSGNILYTIFLFIKGFFFQSTFRGSWFITANVFATLIIGYLSDRHSNKTIFVLSFFIYALCCMPSSYSFLLEKSKPLYNFFAWYEKCFGSPYQSFFVALVWNVVGKMFSENKNTLKENNYLVTLVFAVLFYSEFYIIKKNTGVIDYDCYLMMLPLSVSIFDHLIKHNVYCRYSTYLRHTSTMVYLLHGSLRPIVSHFVREHDEKGIITFTLVLSLSYIFCYIVLKLQKKYTWLKILY